MYSGYLFVKRGLTARLQPIQQQLQTWRQVPPQLAGRPVRAPGRILSPEGSTPGKPAGNVPPPSTDTARDPDGVTKSHDVTAPSILSTRACFRREIAACASPLFRFEPAKRVKSPGIVQLARPSRWDAHSPSSFQY